MEDVIKMLQDDEHYYGTFGKQYLSNSDISALLNNPKMFRVPESGDNLAYAKGRYFHQLILEPEKAEQTQFVDVSTRTTKAYKQYIDDNGIDFCLLEKEGEEIRQLVTGMLNNFDFHDNIRATGVQYEVPSIKEIEGVMWKGKADIIHPEMIIDLKTTGNINDFKWSARKYNYDSQCYIYQQLFGKPLVFYVVDKSTGMLGMFKPTEEFVQRGHEKVKRAVEVYHTFFGEAPTKDVRSYYIDESL